MSARRFTIDIDIGSTCTDGFFTDGKEFRLAKVLTTPHDLAECTITCIAAGAEQFGLDLASFLRDAIVTRLSSTLGTNLVVQRSGTRLGLLVTEGNQHSLYGTTSPATILDQFVPASMVLGVDEEIDNGGRIHREPPRDQVLARVRSLLDLGARIVVVSLRNAWRNPHNENLVRSYVHERYPAQYLRSVPVQIGTEVVHAADDHARTNSAVLNAYIHPPMARSLYRIEDRLRDNGHTRPLLVVHAHGGSGRIAKTVALHTLSSGPAVAVCGAAQLCEQLGISRALTIDMGGTSLDAALVTNHQFHLQRDAGFGGVRLATPMIAVDSIAAGGSTVARVDDGRLRVGPESRGIAPGPACYGRGGTDATVTDVNLALGYLDPDYFLGGTLKLDRSRAERAIQRNLAGPLKLDPTAAALAVRDKLTDIMGASLLATLKRAGGSPEAFTMFVLGGCGALHACALAERIGIKTLLAFPYSSVFSAFGASTTDVQHFYSRTLSISREPEALERNTSEIDALILHAIRDMEVEGFGGERVSATLYALNAHDTSEPTLVARCRLAEASGRRWSDPLIAASGTDPKQPLTVEVRLVAVAQVPHWKDFGSANDAVVVYRPPVKGERHVHWNARGPQSTPIFDSTSLAPGVAIEGPGIVESPITNYVIAPGWRFTVDGRNSYLFETVSD